MASTLCLLLRGVSVACSNAKGGANPIAEFMNSVAPPPFFCVLVVAFRSQAVLLGVAVALAPRLASDGWLGPFGGSGPTFAAGILAGAWAARSILRVWYA